MTFSIVARCTTTGAIGAATATAGPAVGALVLHGASLAGAIATQAMTNPVAGLKATQWLQQGINARACLQMMLDEDEGRDLRQWIVIDSQGQSVDWTGGCCLPWCGSLSEENLAIAGNMLAGEQVIQAALLQIVGGDKLIIPLLLMELHMNPFKGRHFQRDIILWAVRWYCKYGISYRELQEMLAERGVNVEALLQIVGGDKLIIPFC